MRDTDTVSDGADVVLGEDWADPQSSVDVELRDSRRRRKAISVNRSPLARKIITFNLLGLVVLVAGVLYLNPVRDSLVAQRERALVSTAELLAEVPLLISVDTGVLHLSAAVSGRAIGLHGPTHAARWGSVSPAALGLDSPHPAGGFVQYGWEDHPQAEEIMPMLTPERVLSAALDKLEAQPRLRANEDA